MEYVGMGKGERQRLARQVQSSGAGPCSGCEPGPEANRTRGQVRRDGGTEGRRGLNAKVSVPAP